MHEVFHIRRQRIGRCLSYVCVEITVGTRGKDRNFMFVSRNGAVGCEDDKPEIAWPELWRGKM